VTGILVAAVDEMPTVTPATAPGMHLLPALSSPPATSVDFPDRFKVRTVPGPLLPPWREALSSGGTRIEERLGRHTWLVQVLDAGELYRIEHLPFVQSVARYSAADSGPITPVARAAARMIALAVEGVPTSIFEVLLHRGESVSRVKSKILAVGATVLGSSLEKLRVRGTRTSLREVAAVEAWQPPQLACAHARALTRTNPIVGADAQTLYSGTGEMVAIADTGLDAQHDAFTGRQPKLFPRGRPETDDPHGHGTHVAAIAVGREGQYTGGHGIAPGADLLVQCLLDASGGLSGLPIDLNELLLEAYKEGARIHNNSWGAAVKGAWGRRCLRLVAS
jgi:serine protease AprX